MELMLEGVIRYREHPYRRDLVDPDSVWAQGGSTLRDYGGTGPPLLLVPSLVNRGYILDLSAKKSLARWLAANGFHPYLLDWGDPGAAETGFTLSDYIAGRLNGALDSVVQREKRPPVLIGYCMGGLLATALACRRQDDLSALVVLATPWDFHAGNAARSAALANWFRPFQPVIEQWGELPVDAIQALFAWLDPMLVPRKFIRFAELDENSLQAEDFVALEDWLNDGVPLVAGVARETLLGWYGSNQPASGNWQVAGLVVDPGQLRLPTLALIPAQDRIVPPASAQALAGAIPGATLQTPPYGHIGMIAGGGAGRRVWAPMAEWLRAHG